MNEEHVAFLRYIPSRVPCSPAIEVCDSDAVGAFKVYRSDASLRAALAAKEKAEGALCRAREALETISNPIVYLQAEADKEGAHLNGMFAIQVSQDANWLKGIAKSALPAPPQE